MKVKRYFVSIAIAFICIGCSSAATKGASSDWQGIVSTVDFSADPKSFDGKDVHIRGFLGILGRDLVIYPNKYEAEKFNFQKNSVFVYDSSPERFLGLEEVDGRLNCTGNYVELNGTGGLLKARSIYGIVEIKSITTFEDDEFDGDGQACYP